jgi:hypothetical protein
MFSRYDAMAESKIVDTVDQVAYPDPLTVNFNNLHLSEIPKLRTVSKVDLDRFWLFILRQYKTIAEGDDIVLTMNGIPYVGMLEPGDQLYIPISADMYAVKDLKGLS